MVDEDLHLGCAGEPLDVELSQAVFAEDMETIHSLDFVVQGALSALAVSAAPTYFHWSSLGIPPLTGSCSSNLQALFNYAQRTYPGTTSYGCYNRRVVAGSSTWSSHAWGAAFDIHLPSRTITEQFWDFCIRNYIALGINTIHDYILQRMWKPGQGWVSASIGSQGGTWTHIETTQAMFGDGRSVELKITGFEPGPPVLPPQPGVVYDPWHDKWGLFPVNANKSELQLGSGYTSGTQPLQPLCTYLNHVMVFKAHQIVHDPFIVCTQSSIDATRNVRAFFDPQIKDVAWGAEAYRGIVGPRTWAITDGLATNFGRN